MSTSTPWGPSQGKTVLSLGIIQYSTAGHGGIHVCPSLNAQIHEAWREENGWYEEDCDWAVVAYHFPGAFKFAEVTSAIITLKNWQPHQYTKVTGQPVSLEESHTLLEEAFRAANINNMVCVSAVGDWHKGVPPGMVGVTACIGGRNEHGHYGGPLRYFLVPAADYAGRGMQPLVVDPAKHQEAEKLF